MSAAQVTVVEAIRGGADYLTARGVASARLDAELILAHTLGLTRLDLYLAFERPLTEEERDRARTLLARRGKREPLAHLTGEREFFSLAFEVTPATLIPRPETERLVEQTIALDREGALPEGDLLDVGTGSGCIAVALAHALPARRVTATETSADALKIARRNAARHGVTARVNFAPGDLAAGQRGPFAAVVSNPPYIAAGDRASLAPEVRAEPEAALFAGTDGLDIIRRLVATTPDLLAPRGWLLLEIGAGQAREVERLMDAAGFREITIHRDLAGIERVIQGMMANTR